MPPLKQTVSVTPRWYFIPGLAHLLRKLMIMFFLLKSSRMYLVKPGRKVKDLLY